MSKKEAKEEKVNLLRQIFDGTSSVPGRAQMLINSSLSLFFLNNPVGDGVLLSAIQRVLTLLLLGIHRGHQNLI